MGSTLTVDNIKDSGDNTLVSSTGSGFKMNLSGTAPSSPVAGDMHFDTTSNTLKIYNGAAWLRMATDVAIGGNIISKYSGYTSHTFTSNGTFIILDDALTCDILIVGGGGAGGGAGGNDGAGGGGAGGMVVATGVSVASGSHTVTIGDGAAGSIEGVHGVNGQDSSFPGQTTADGGGGGGGEVGGDRFGFDGGSGGGDGGYGAHAGGTGAGTVGTDGNIAGYYGGDGAVNQANGHSGGGGGAGENADTDGAGQGGDGLQNNFQTGYNQWYAGGGGGSGDGRWRTAGSVAGDGGGGFGAPDVTGGQAENGSPNTGGGGGGAAGINDTGGHYYSGAGGSGIVVIRYAS